MTYAAIIFDLDGTAMPSARHALPSDHLAAVTNEYKGKVHLCAATGRTWPMAQDVVKKLGLVDPCIVSGGAVIVDPANEEILWQEVINHNSLKSIVTVAQRYTYPVTYAAGLQITQSSPQTITDIAADINTFYILDIESGDVQGILDELAHIEHITISKALSWNVENGIDLHITNKEATKEHAVVELCKMLGVKQADVAGVGDGYNDIHLFNAVGHKLAMGNAVPELKEVADEVIGSIDDEGLAELIERSA